MRDNRFIGSIARAASFAVLLSAAASDASARQGRIVEERVASTALANLLSDPLERTVLV